MTRHYVLGLEVVLADGTVMRTGGRVHKNKTGFDLTALFVGSEGMLGVVTEATLRLIPHPPARGMLAAVFPDFPAAAACVQGIFNAGHLPSALEITDAFTLRAARAYPRRRYPAGRRCASDRGNRRPAALPWPKNSARLRGLLESHGAMSIDEATDEAGCERIWNLRRQFSTALRHTGLTKLNEDIVVPRSRLVELVRFCEGLENETGIPVACFGHAGDGNIHANVMVADYEDPPSRRGPMSAWTNCSAGCWRTKVRSPANTASAWRNCRWIADALGPATMAADHAIKNALDPQRHPQSRQNAAVTAGGEWPNPSNKIPDISFGCLSGILRYGTPAIPWNRAAWFASGQPISATATGGRQWDHGKELKGR